MIRFAEFTLDPERGLLLRAGAPIELQPKPYELLVLLTSSPGRLFTRAELDAALWPDVTVSDDSLPQAVRRLRTALGDDARSPRFVENVARRGYRWLAAVVSDARIAPAAPPSLPRPEDPLVGRGAELETLRAALVQARVVTLVGPGGIGKTRLALEVPEVTAWCRLGAVTDAASLRDAVADGLGLPPEAATREGLRRALRSGSGVVLLDEAEGAAPEVASAVADWLAAAPEARLLVTSRVRLGLAAERCVELGPLPQRDGAALYVARAAAVEPAAHDAMADVLALVDALDGWPLAIELAAARRPILDAAAVLARVTRSLGVLEQPRADRPDRHRSLEATLAWSWALLSEPDRIAAARLSSFVGGLSLEAAEPVLADLDDPLGRLESLRQRSWLRRVGARFEQYAPLRRFAAGRCDALGIRADATARFVAALAEWAQAHLYAGTATLAPERANLWAAFHAATDAERAWALLRALVRIDTHAERSPGPLVRAVDRALGLAAGRPDLEVALLVQRSRLRLRDDRVGAEADARAALAAAGERPADKGAALRAVGLSLPSGHPEQLPALSEAVRLARGDPAEEAGALANLGMILGQRGRAAEAVEALLASIVRWEALGRGFDAARARLALVNAAVHTQDLGLAHAALLDAGPHLDPQRDAALYGRWLSGLALIAWFEERLDDAVALCLQEEAVGQRAWLLLPSLPVRRRAEIALERGDHDQARALYASCGAAPTPLGRAEQGQSELMLLVAERRWAEAEQNTDWRAEAYRDAGYRLGEAGALVWRALVRGAQGDVVGAARWADLARGLLDPALGRIVGGMVILADAAAPFAAGVAGDRSAAGAVAAAVAALDASAPLGPTTGRPALAPDLRLARRLLVAGPA